MKSDRIVIGLSGGVDSAVSAYLLKAAGYDVLAIFMKNWEEEDTQYCHARQDWIDAAAVADFLNIDIEAVNFSQHYQEQVFAYFLQEYARGRTPNPDILCNSEIKFHTFLSHALSLGAKKIATGHYARINHRADQPRLLKGIDEQKDQSYFLYRLNAHQLSHALFPLGGMTKQNVRKIAADIGLPNARKKDSTGICFIGKRPFREFLNLYLPKQRGPIYNDAGLEIGQHMGLAFYTIGQRKGLGIGGKKFCSDNPWYVAKKNLSQNALYVVQDRRHPWLLKQTIALEQLVSAETIVAGKTYYAKTRYRQAVAACRVEPGPDQTAIINFVEPQWAVAPGQSAVIYDHQDVCVGGGIICDYE